MAAMPQIQSETARAIEAARVQERRDELAEKGRTGDGYRISPSTLGKECERALWYTFRWVSPPVEFSGQMLRLFETGHIQETRLIEDLRRIGCTVVEFEDEPGKDGEPKQIGVSFADGHGYGFLDFEVIGIPEAPKTIHVGEAKSHNDKSFKATVQKGVRKHKPEHFAQTQFYMHLRNRTRGLYIFVNKDTDEVASERLEYDFALCVGLDRKALRIVHSPMPLPKISDDPDFHVCRFCDHVEHCHHGAAPRKHCRTCVHVTPIAGGNWLCERHNRDIDRDEQTAGCPDHLLIPELVAGDQIDANVEEGWIAYATPDGRVYRNRRESMGGDEYV